MKRHRFSGCYPDWRRDGARDDDLAGAESLAKVGKQRGNVTNDVNQFTGQRFKIGSVCQLLTIPKDPRAQARQRATCMRGVAAA